MTLSLKRITREDIQIGEPVVAVMISHEEMVQRFGPPHSGHPPDWDAPGPVDLWFFELPWEHRITLECHLTASWVNVYLGSLEIDSVLEYLGLNNHDIHVDSNLVELLRRRYPAFTRDLSPSKLCRLDDNGNQVLMRTFESRRIADHYQQVYEARGHKQLYWVEEEGRQTGPAGTDELPLR